jgi:protein tyrosine/serine phosphatase
MNNDRILTWDGFLNARDLGGFNTRDGRLIRRGAAVRSDTPARLTAPGWSELYAYGIRTIITLRTHGMVEDELNFTPRYPDIETVQAVIEDITDKEFLQKWAATDLWSTPLYYRDALERWPERHAAVISAIARARPGGVLFHCIRGHDRTGIIALLLLSIAGVVPSDILADYELSLDPVREELLAAQHTSTRDVILSTLEWLDVDNYLLASGLGKADLETVRERLLEPPGRG